MRVPATLPKGYPRKNWGEVEGDAYSPQTWKELDKDMKGRDIPAFDLILCRPQGFLKQLSRKFVEEGTAEEKDAFLAVHHRLLGRMWTRLSNDEGLMLGQLTPAIVESSQFQSWMKTLKTEGVDAEVFVNT